MIITNSKNLIGEIQLHYTKQQNVELEKITSSRQVNECIRKFFPIEQINHREHMYALYLNNSNRITGYYLISIGGITGTLVDIRVVLQAALLSNSVAMIMVHNHPSGTLKPSGADKAITKKIQNAGEMLDIKLIDHLIITEDNYYSFADENMM
ncbi:JAB domain-containing protein [Kordia sp.]|uniref:JAB domain-containing protein n=1 Tax=Kordia sp. TaxID=1965332 RepID=UPI003D6C0D98